MKSLILLSILFFSFSSLGQSWKSASCSWITSTSNTTNSGAFNSNDALVPKISGNQLGACKNLIVLSRARGSDHHRELGDMAYIQGDSEILCKYKVINYLPEGSELYETAEYLWYRLISGSVDADFNVIWEQFFSEAKVKSTLLFDCGGLTS